MEQDDRKKLILGIDLNRDYVQATYWRSDRIADPKSLDAKENTNLLTPEAFLTEYLKQCLPQLTDGQQDMEVQIMVTVRSLTEERNRQIVGALLDLGFDKKKIYAQDYLASFFYYAVNQKKELWAQDVALLTYEEDAIVGYVLHIDRSKRPALAQVNEVARQPMGENVRAGRQEEEWAKEKDRLFFELLKKVFERRTVTVSYLVGDYFNKSWAVRSIQFLCSQRRAYQGMNLYSKGACFAAMERANFRQTKGLIFGGRDMVSQDIGMEMNIRGKRALYPLVDAGVNWYEVHTVVEFIPHGEREIRLISRPAGAGDTTIHSMRLPGLPKRPDRATRLRMTISFTSPSCCQVDIEDLGFGGLYKSSGMSWNREIIF